jgi:5-methyltetrahydropteroyltriglutamate--homocysteine methyltransferase
MDDTNLAYLCDPKMREGAKQRGDDPDELPHRYASFINRVVAQKPPGMTLCTHLCRGNFKSTWAAEGGYEPVAEALLSEMKVDGYFLEYDDERSGDFRPLRFLPKGKTVVLGLVTTKVGTMESKDTLKRRIDEAAATCRSSSSRCRRSAAFPAPCTATTLRWRRRRQSSGSSWMSPTRSGVPPRRSHARTLS